MYKNKIIVNKILEMIDTLIEASKYLCRFVNDSNYVEFQNVSLEMNNMLKSIYKTLCKIKKEEDIVNVDLICESVMFSLNRIRILSKSRSEKTLSKLEFELVPLLQEMYSQFYFWSYIYGDKDRVNEYYRNEMLNLCSNKYIDLSEKKGKYKYDLSIVVIGYNKLEYTKQCIENLLNYVQCNIKYELILVNHGSEDGTKEYFEFISPTKQLDIFRNGGGIAAVSRIIEGKYTLSISNDVIITKNCIENMIRCIKSDENIAWVVPSTPNVSNFQTIEGKYSNIEEMHNFAEKNNISNIYRWEQRSKLCNPIDLAKSSAFYSSKGINFWGHVCGKNQFSFPDDKISYLLRRNGYKMVLAKDAYCYHFGSVTLKEEIVNCKDEKTNKNIFYEQGRAEFKEAFGIDPWGTGFCWDPQLFAYLPCNDTDHVDILGVNCGIGSNPLKIRESIKENVHNLDAVIYNVTDEQCYVEDLKGVSDIAQYVESIENLPEALDNTDFKYIVLESNLEKYKEPTTIVEKLKQRLKKEGILAVKCSEKYLKAKVVAKYPNSIEAGQWIILKNL